MKSCPRCGAANQDDALYCNRCGTSLASGVGASAQPDDYYRYRHYHWHYYRSAWSAFWGVLFGLFIIIIGLGIIYPTIWSWFWPTVLILIGVAIVIGALYRSIRRR